jgi:hypothetical protein
MVIAGDRQHMVAINHPNYLKYMMGLDANGARARTVKRTSVTVEVTLGTRMSCMSSVSRDEDNGSDNKDNLDDGQQRTPPRLSVPCGNRAIQMEQGRRAAD